MKIEQLQEFPSENKRFYVIVLTVTNPLVVSDFIAKTEQLQDFSKQIRVAIERLE